MGNRKKSSKRSLLPIIALLPMLAAAPPALATDGGVALPGVSAAIDGRIAAMDDPARIAEGRLFLPAAPLARQFDGAVDWEPHEEKMTIRTADGRTIAMRIGVPVATVDGTRYLMDAAPFLADGRTYLPIRYFAAFLSVDVEWRADERLASFRTLAPGEDAVSGFLRAAEPYAEEELQLLAKLVQVEAGYESYEGQLAIANVILNRVKDPRFPATIRDVIYAGKQFPPAHNGLLDASEPGEIALRAARDALDGKNNVEDAVYFYNPDVTSGSFWDALDVVASYENHNFAK